MAGRGLFVTLEGGEGSGKSTQALLLAGRLGERGLQVVSTREPAGTPLGAALWQLLARGEAAPQAELFLFAAARADHVERVLRPALARGDMVLCDRFFDSTLAYQGYGRGLDLALVRRVSRDEAAQGLTPDLTLLFDLPPEEGLRRKGGGPADALGCQGLEFHRRVRGGYLALAAAEPGRFVVLDATLPPGELGEQAWAALAARIP